MWKKCWKGYFLIHIMDWILEYFPLNCSQVYATQPHWWYINTGSGNGLVPPGNKPLPDHMLTQIYVAIIWCQIYVTILWCPQATSHHLHAYWHRFLSHLSSLGHDELKVYIKGLVQDCGICIINTILVILQSCTKQSHMVPTSRELKLSSILSTILWKFLSSNMHTCQPVNFNLVSSNRHKWN